MKKKEYDDKIEDHDANMKKIGTTKSEFGTGRANTNAIIKFHNQKNLAKGYAAAVARAYRGGGFTDWYLPSAEELKLIFNNKGIINSTATANGGVIFGPLAYWSSTEQSNLNAKAIRSSAMGNNEKKYATNLRAIRAF
ncbi:DUF1566 domain-containing protein [Gillisia marina]|uniref:DUF1566 domain-containing protein n=1 Tax=Gillisia marina TaxID=1167637 RepID=UPI00029B1661|nr:DUF1566 domain-containing protein [Gillisia marina]